MSYQIGTTSRFRRRLKRFLRQHPDLRQRFAQLLRDLEADPFQPHLKLHSLSGRLEGLHAVSLTYSYRVMLVLAVDEARITLIDIGSHDDIYR